MKKFLVSLLVVAVVGGAIAWSKRADIILALAKYQSSQRYADVGPLGKFHGSRGPPRRWKRRLSGRPISS